MRLYTTEHKPQRRIQRSCTEFRHPHHHQQDWCLHIFATEPLLPLIRQHNRWSNVATVLSSIHRSNECSTACQNLPDSPSMRYKVINATRDSLTIPGACTGPVPRVKPWAAQCLSRFQPNGQTKGPQGEMVVAIAADRNASTPGISPGSSAHVCFLDFDTHHTITDASTGTDHEQAHRL